MSRPEQQPAPVFLGVECGGTHSVAILAESSGKKAIRFEAGPANLRLLNDQQLVEHFRKISFIHKKDSRLPTSVAIGMAGARTDGDRQRIRLAAAKVWPKARYYATNDLETALCAVDSPG